jgi:hypothetical protein
LPCLPACALPCTIPLVDARLNTAEARNDSAKRALKFVATPHFFFVDAVGAARESMQRVIPADSVRAALDRLIGSGASPR